MKQVHNVRVSVRARSKTLAERALAQAEALARGKDEDVIERTLQEEDELWRGELWIDHQQPVRRFVRTLLANMTVEDKARVREQPTKFLDTRTHCFLHFDIATFAEGKYTFVQDAGRDIGLTVRLNIASFPATKEGSTPVLVEIFRNGIQ